MIVEFKNGKWVDKDGVIFLGHPEKDLQIGDSFILKERGMKLLYTIQKREWIDGQMKVKSFGRILEGNKPLKEIEKEILEQKEKEIVGKRSWLRWWKK